VFEHYLRYISAGLQIPASLELKHITLGAEQRAALEALDKFGLGHKNILSATRAERILS
jgi:hypothetical protein